jgi:hypothetical protein
LNQRELNRFRAPFAGFCCKSSVRGFGRKEDSGMKRTGIIVRLSGANSHDFLLLFSPPSAPAGPRSDRPDR